MIDFAIAFLVVIATLYAPGYFVGRALSLARTSSLALAPAFTIALLVGEGVVLYAAGISCPAWTLAGIALVVALVVRAASWGSDAASPPMARTPPQVKSVRPPPLLPTSPSSGSRSPSTSS